MGCGGGRAKGEGATVARLPPARPFSRPAPAPPRPAPAAPLPSTHHSTLPALREVFVGHHTGACARRPGAPPGAPGHHRHGWAGARGPGAGAQLACVDAAAAARAAAGRRPRVHVARRDPSAETDYEARTLARLAALGAGGAGGGAAGAAVWPHGH
jgi:hypothetical protein